MLEPAVTISLNGPLRDLAGGKDVLEARGRTVYEAILAASEDLPELAQALIWNGALRRFVNVYLDAEDIRTRNGQETPVSDGARIDIVLAVSGG